LRCQVAARHGGLRVTEAKTDFDHARIAPVKFHPKSLPLLSVKVSVKLPAQGLKSNEK
jgi:hypothetical protein